MPDVVNLFGRLLKVINRVDLMQKEEESEVQDNPPMQETRKGNNVFKPVSGDNTSATPPTCRKPHPSEKLIDTGGKIKNELRNSAVESKSSGELIETGRIESQAINYELAERMAIMGENCESDQVQPYITDFGVLVIPFNSNPKYHYWNKGQSICTTLKELGRCDLIEKYTSPYYLDGN